MKQATHGLFLALASLLLASCGRALVGQGGGTPPPTDGGLVDAGPALPDVIRIGLLVQNSEDFPEFENWGQLAVDEINALGGIEGTPVELLVRNDRARQTFAQDAARELVQDEGVSFLISASGSFAALAVAQYAEQARVPYIADLGASLSAWDDIEVEGGERYSFGRSLSQRDLTVAAMEQIGPPGDADASIECSSAYYLADFREGEEEALAEIVQNDLALKGIPLLASETILPGETDFTRFFEAFLEDGAEIPECFLTDTDRSVAPAVLTEWATVAGFEAPRPEILIQLGERPRPPNRLTPPLSTGYFITSDFPRSSVDPVVTGRLAAYEAAYPDAEQTEIPNAVHSGIRTYDFVSLAVLAIRAAGTTNGRDVRAALLRVSRLDMPGATELRAEAGAWEDNLMVLEQGLDIDYQGLWGDLDFRDGDQRAVSDLIVGQYQNFFTGEWSLVQTIPVSD